MSLRILLAEDERNIREPLMVNLEIEGFEVVLAKDGAEALELFAQQKLDLIILDVMMPKINGFDVCQQIRLTHFDIPVIFLTAKDTPNDRINGLKKGADDYLVKPFHFEELILRIRNLLKKVPTQNQTQFTSISFGANKVDFEKYQATTGSGSVKLTKKEIKLLKLFIDRKNEVVSRQDILQAVWGYDVFPSTRTVDNFILSFRKYFESDSRNPKHFISVRGVGYKFIYPS
jgi:two-component system alkaline phosphatase synthesis response regulator PhoP